MGPFSFPSLLYSEVIESYLKAKFNYRANKLSPSEGNLCSLNETVVLGTVNFTLLTHRISSADLGT